MGGAAASWNDSITPFSLCGNERGGWGGCEGGFTPVKTSSPLSFPILDTEKGEWGWGLLHLMLRESFSGNLANYLSP